MVEASDADRAADTSTFLNALFGEVPPDKHALFWTLQNKSSTWVPLATGTEDVALRARALSDEGMDVYVAVSVANHPGKAWTRIESANSAGLMGLWADIDIADPDVHKKWNLPPDEKSALELIDRCGAEPTLVVHSGHGLQVWWLFHEFWEFDTDEERREAAVLAQKWNTTLRIRAAEKGWTVDSTFDLARVMRVPGTLNRKGSPVVPVKLLGSAGPHWNPTDFESLLADESELASLGISPARSYQPGPMELTDSFPLPTEKFTALLSNSEQFEATWKQQRKDFTDGSPSSYDLSLATQAARAGWTDNEIFALIRDWRRHHKHDVSKAYRTDYMARTIGRARDAVAREQGVEQLEDVAEALDAAKASGDDEEIRKVRRAALDGIGQQLGIEITHIVKFTSDPPTFLLVTPTRSIDLGGSEGILNWFKFRQKVWEAIGIQIDRFKPAAWDAITNLVPKAWEEHDVGLEATDAGEVYSWLAQYISQRPPVATLDEAAPSEYPYIDEQGRTVMFGPSFRRWLYLQHQEKLSNQAMGRRLRTFGCRPDKVSLDIEGVRTSRSVWIVPSEKLK